MYQEWDGVSYLYYVSWIFQGNQHNYNTGILNDFVDYSCQMVYNDSRLYTVLNKTFVVLYIDRNNSVLT